MADHHQPPIVETASRNTGSPGEIFTAFLRLGLTSFGGPVAHFGYFHREFVLRRKWISEAAYADLLALCQFLPGPASSQAGFLLGCMRGGLAGGLLAWLAFTGPSAVLMILLALGLQSLPLGNHAGWLTGLKVAAVAVVAQAIIAMAIKLCPDFLRALLALLAAGALLLATPVWLQPLIIGLGGLAGLLFLRSKASSIPEETPAAPGLLSSRRFAVALLVVFAALLGASFWLPGGNLWVKTFGIFYRTGALVFGGGHVVLPLLQAGAVDTGLVSHDRFLAGYGAAQALPGPLFAFSAFLGSSIHSPAPVLLGLWCLAAIYLPALLLAAGVLPFWSQLSASRSARAALLGANAVVVGLLAAVFLNAIGQNHLFTLPTGLLGLAAFAILQGTKFPNWLVVIACALAGQIFL